MIKEIFTKNKFNFVARRNMFAAEHRAVNMSDNLDNVDFTVIE